MQNHDREKAAAVLELLLLLLLLRFCFSALGNGKRILLSVDVSVIAARVGQKRALSAQPSGQDRAGQDRTAQQIGLRGTAAGVAVIRKALCQIKY